MLLDVLHGCDLGLGLGVAFDGDSGCPATPVGELKQANNVVGPVCDLAQSDTLQMAVGIRRNEAYLIP